MSPAALVLLLSTLVACSGAHLEAEDVQLELVSLLDGDMLPVVANGTPVASYQDGKQPNLQWVQDTSQAFGLPTYLDAAHAGANGHAGLNFNRNDYPRLRANAEVHHQREDWVIVTVLAPTTAIAIATTRGYIEGWTEDLVLEGTRFVYAQNDNGNSTPQHAHPGCSLDDNNNERAGMNRGWHLYYGSADPGPPSTAGAALSTIGLQVRVDVLTSNGLPFLIRNGKLIGVMMPNQYVEPYRRSPKFAVLGNDIPGGAPGNTTGMYDGAHLYRALYRVVSGRPSVAAMKALCAVQQARFNVANET